MPFVSPKSVLAIAVVADVAIHGLERPVPARALVARNKLPPRHLEPMLQALARNGILKGIRGPNGGYQLGRDQRHITAEDIVSAAREAIDPDQPQVPAGALVSQVVQPALREAMTAFSAALAQITVEDMAHRAESLKIA